MNDAPSRQSIVDEEQLRALRLGYFIAGGTMVFYAALGAMYAAMGALFVPMIRHMPVSPARPPPPQNVGWIFVLFGMIIVMFAGSLAALRLRVARCLRQRTSREFCLVVAALSCIEMPYGTALGVMTFAVLGRASVKELFKGRGSSNLTS